LQAMELMPHLMVGTAPLCLIGIFMRGGDWDEKD
jgi:hypothetical protein